MTNLKKVFALLVVFTMVLSTVAFAAPYADVKDDASYAEAVSTLSALGLLMGDDKGNFNPDNTITRAEVAAVIIRALGLGESGKAKMATDFTDVASDFWGSGYVKLAAQMGVVNGYGDSKFGPEDPVTYEQAVKMIVAALGYTPKASQQGGYPTGYMMVAAQEGINDKVSGKVGDPAKRWQVAQMMFNALDVPMMEQTGYGSDITYEVMNGKNEKEYKTLLTEKLDVDKIEGIVTDNLASDNKGKKVEDKKIEITYDTINGDSRDTYFGKDVADEKAEKVLINGTNAPELFGKTVVAYVRDLGDSDQELIAIVEKGGENNTLTIDVDDINTVSVSKASINYDVDDSDDDDADLSSNVKFVYNNVLASDSEFDIADLTNADLVSSGVIELVDNNDDDEYDYVFVKAYQNAIVDEVDTDDNTISYKDDSADVRDEFDPDDKDYAFSFFMDGKEIEIKDIKEWDVLSVMENIDGDVCTVYVTRQKVDGEVTEQDPSDDTKVQIDGTDYTVASNLEGKVSLRDKGTFYLDMQGKIAANDTTSADTGNYAVILEGSVSTWNTFEAKLLTSEGKEVKYPINEDVTLYKEKNDKKVTLKIGDTLVDDDASVFAALVNGITETDEEGNTTRILDSYLKVSGNLLVNNKQAVVKYELNKSGEINEIIIPESEAQASNKEFDDYDNSLGNFYVTDKTIVFDLTKGAAKYDDYAVTSKDLFKDSKEYTAVAYDLDNEDAKVVVVTTKATGELGTNLAVVQDVRNALKDGDDVQKAVVMIGGEEKTLFTEEDNVLGSDVIPGSLIAYDLTVNGEIEEGTVTVLFKPSTANVDDAISAARASVYGDAIDDEDVEMVYGRVYEKNSTSVKIGGKVYGYKDGAATEDATDADYNYTLRDAKVYEYDIAREEVSSKTTNVIREYKTNDAEITTDDSGSYVLIYRVEDKAQIVIVLNVEKNN